LQLSLPTFGKRLKFFEKCEKNVNSFLVYTPGSFSMNLENQPDKPTFSLTFTVSAATRGAHKSKITARFLTKSFIFIQNF
jgi:hypothetical protein